MIRILQLTLPILQKAVPFGLLFALIISFITRKKTIRFFLALLTRRKSREIIFIGFLVSLGIEITQVVFSLGYGQMDDLIANTLGTAIGVLFTRFVKH